MLDCLRLEKNKTWSRYWRRLLSFQKFLRVIYGILGNSLINYQRSAVETLINLRFGSRISNLFCLQASVLRFEFDDLILLLPDILDLTVRRKPPFTTYISLHNYWKSIIVQWNTVHVSYVYVLKYGVYKMILSNKFDVHKINNMLFYEGVH